jgi:hypothetical protein
VVSDRDRPTLNFQNRKRSSGDSIGPSAAT